MHIVEELIQERAPKLVASAAWPVVKPVLYGVLGYGKAVAMADAIADLPGEDALAHVSRLLSLDTAVSHIDRIPKTGRCVVLCNHPTGIADGVAVYDALRRVRGDAIFFANADALRVSPRLSEVIIPVEWVEVKRTREKTRATLLAARDAFDAERCVVLFPAGRLARRDAQGRLSDPPWATTAVSLAQKYAAPIVPIHVAGPDSVWFHTFNRFSPELRDITLFHELLNKAGKRFDLTVGPVLAPEKLDMETGLLCDRLKVYIERDLRDDPDKAAL
ncbi:1-acyl-sn-glycerol-3-phosphate acyltransferase [Asticcacaulis sp. BYS171W]|uniref:1-acyl-sn-glycerol-3-phosphate acyltransferase n=1 Tax=Asticcacaulis aquaticus TaxID=2984212 RepID=A0ABT5HSD3_9CAUL|nr:1-acyl-sn-glycerol-3-phosphate acyltransferase [Asticcacaulis aquaticus]MDC7682962.1 1-acyl-sn-glycerol-3-phosphate acyltransferase [Asticcacaulis aquaticus]